MKLKIETLTADAFADFGQVIDTEVCTNQFAINGGTTQRFHDLAEVETIGEARGGISIFRGDARQFPMKIEMLERHPKGSQAFVPLQQRPYLVIVAPALNDEEPDLSRLRLFYATGAQGVNYFTGTWHHPLLALEEVSDFLVVDRIGEGHNCDEFHFPEESDIQIAAMSYEGV